MDMKTYEYTITFDVMKDFKVRANSPEEANHILHKRVERMIKSVSNNSNIRLDNPNGYLVSEECLDDDHSFPYTH